MITLAIETSTAQGSIAVFGYGEIAFSETFTADRSHSASLFTALERAKKCTRRIDQVAVGLGPGSYAGVRIAISGALGLQMGLGAMLLGIPSVAALETEEREYLAIGDARQGTFYFTRVRGGICLDGPSLVSPEELRSRLDEHANLPVYTSAPLQAYPTAEVVLPSAVVLARLAAAGQGITAEGTLEPIYLREPHITQPRPR